ncbi:hypothetical protein PHLGIDRAFT_38362 [Phlebiopsis gigantea 11061_1 CR5-6]|uniref:F-box domain-containing protein n=1 Tax=Phlebiopsis gigantea (strain 11061_1 CR5-6) TaxID=745531 RepID=A0A0C3N9P6_PHLG1|nr:hypothetical protein PHLGIDRAFT_38362 [Phlebiopsis gigantea 11061_1 CR5-6]
MSRPADKSSVVSHVAGRVRKPASIIRRTSRLWSRSRTKVKQDSEVATQTNAVNDLTTLNYDVLQAVMKFLKPKELLLVMHTCRILYGFGVPLLLDTVHYTHLQQRHSYVLYRHFLLSDPSRFIHIRSLRCEYMDYPLLRPDTHTLFVDFLRYATRLCALDILFDFGIEVDDRILAPIATLAHLRRLHLRGCHWAPFARLLATITAPLAALGVHLHEPSLKFGHTLPPPLDIFTSIAAFRASLVLLELETCDDFDVSPPHTSFPCVQHLVWRSTGAVDAATLAALFPAVHELDVRFSAQIHIVVRQLGGVIDAHGLYAPFNAVPQGAAARRQRRLDGM